MRLKNGMLYFPELVTIKEYQMLEIKHKLTGEVLYRSDVAETIRDAVVSAVKIGANLYRADLSGANLSEANLRGADLRGANLSEANIRGANLRGANLSGANLSEANLSEANLSGANLRGADLSRATIRDAETISFNPIFIDGLKWPVSIFDVSMNIGCEWHTLVEWKAMTDEQISSMHCEALAWWTSHKELLMGVAKANGRIV
jgi:hypothetical protein